MAVNKQWALKRVQELMAKGFDLSALPVAPFLVEEKADSNMSQQKPIPEDGTVVDEVPPEN